MVAKMVVVRDFLSAELRVDLLGLSMVGLLASRMVVVMVDS